MSRFVAGGINLRKSGALDVGQRPLAKNTREEEEATFPFAFADFFNYFVVRDLLESVQLIAANADAFGGIVNSKRLDEFARRLAAQDCWFGALDGAESFAPLVEALDRRIAAYRKFHIFATNSLPGECDQTRTTIGEPVSRCAECMRVSGLVPSNTPVFVRVDELERLSKSDVIRPGLGEAYRRLINKAIGMRDSRVSYRVGTRRYGWENDLYVFGTADKLENLRDYRIIDLDENMRRAENRKDWVFPRFAADTLRRRLRTSGVALQSDADVLKHVFGIAPTHEAAVREYVAASSKSERILKVEKCPDRWRKFLDELFVQSPLDAMLAAAWARQKGSPNSRNRMDAPPPKGEAHWKKEYWRKERIRQAVMQIAARAPHRLKWSGKDQMLALSGANITVFLSICHAIWDALHRSRRASEAAGKAPSSAFPIERNAQTVGIHTASEHWHSKISEQPGGGDRQRFVNIIGAQFRDWLLKDPPMSHPGWNGFSLDLANLERHPHIVEFLNDAVAYGDLYASAHTTKERNRSARRKWYLNPILSPFFQIPETHTKEPYYATVEEVGAWLSAADVCLPTEPGVVGRSKLPAKAARPRGKGSKSVSTLPDLFGDDDERT